MELTYEQLYGFDAVGYLHVPGILDRAALQQCHRASDIVTAAAELTAEHPVLEACLGRLFGGGAEAIHRQSPVPENLNLDPTLGLGTWRLDTPPRLAVASDACRGSSGAGRFLHDGGGSGHLDARRVRYASESGVILAQGVTAMGPRGPPTRGGRRHVADHHSSLPQILLPSAGRGAVGRAERAHGGAAADGRGGPAAARDPDALALLRRRAAAAVIGLHARLRLPLRRLWVTAPLPRLPFVLSAC